MILRVHEIMIEQNVNDENRWTIIKLIDKGKNQKLFKPPELFGTWKATNNSHNDQTPSFTSSNQEHWYWQFASWHAGKIEIGVKSKGLSSHKAGDSEGLQVLIVLENALRTAGDKFESATISGKPHGTIKNQVSGFFSKGDLLWTPIGG